MLSGFRKVDPPTMKKMPIEVDMSELLVKAGMDGTATEFTKAVGDLALIAFYYLLRVEEYTIKRSQNSTKQTKQFKLEEGTVTAPVTNSTRQKNHGGGKCNSQAG